MINFPRWYAILIHAVLVLGHHHWLHQSPTFSLCLSRNKNKNGVSQREPIAMMVPTSALETALGLPCNALAANISEILMVSRAWCLPSAAANIISHSSLTVTCVFHLPVPPDIQQHIQWVHSQPPYKEMADSSFATNQLSLRKIKCHLDQNGWI